MGRVSPVSHNVIVEGSRIRIAMGAGVILEIILSQTATYDGSQIMVEEVQCVSGSSCTLKVELKSRFHKNIVMKGDLYSATASFLVYKLIVLLFQKLIFWKRNVAHFSYYLAAYRRDIGETLRIYPVKDRIQIEQVLMVMEKN
jgi:hypothetical protein